MTPEEFDFWQKAYLAALTGVCSLESGTLEIDNAYCCDVADAAIDSYRTAKATVVQD